MDSNAKPKTHQKNNLRSAVNYGLTLWDNLTEPSVSVVEPERRRVRLLASTSLAFLLLGAVAILVSLLYGSALFDLLATVAAMAALAGAYALSRAGRAGPAALLLLLPLFAAPPLVAFVDENLLTLNFLCLSVLLASLIAPLRITGMLSLLTLAAAVSFAARFPGTPLVDTLNTLFLLGAVGAVALLAAAIRRRDQQQIERQTGALAASERRYRSLFENAEVGMFRTRLDASAVLDVNDKLSEILGYSKEELLAESVLVRYLDPAARERMVKLLRAQGKLVDYEVRLKTKDGGGKTVLMSMTLYPDEGVLEGSLLDITERQRAEAALRESLERYHRVLDQMLEGCQIIGFDWRYLYVNEAVVRQARKSRNELLGHTMLEVYPGIENTPLFTALRRCLAERAPVRMENQFTFPDGAVGFFELSIQPVPEGLFILSIDITERKRAENEIRRMNAELEQHVEERTAKLEAEIAERKQAEAALHKWAHIFEHAEWGVVIGSADGQRLELMNPAFARMHGYTVEELTGQPIVDVFAPEARAGLPAQIRLAHEKGHHTFESRHIRKDGAVFPALVDVTTVRDEAGQIAYRAVNVQDITEHKRAEEEIHKAKEGAERANRAKSEFLSRMSHELRTPLNAILGFAQLMEMDELTPAQAQGVKHTLKAGRHLLDLINEVLDLARIESGRLAFSPEPVQLRGVIQETLDLVGPAAAARNLTLAFPASPLHDGCVRADRQRLKQVLLNLVSNAVKYNREGGAVTVTTDLTDLSTPVRSIRINIHDTGPGIAPENLSRLFEPFDRLGAEQSQTEGTGLGLAVAKKLTEVMGGTIGVESVVGAGSTFWVELPVTESPLKGTARLRALVEDIVADETKTGTVLYVEDNLSNLELVKAILARRPAIKLSTANQGWQAVRLAREHRPGLILLDLNLPDMHGSEALRRLRADEQTHAIPVVVISADVTPGQIQRLREAGAHDYLTKPLDVHKFLEVVDEVMK